MHRFFSTAQVLTARLDCCSFSINPCHRSCLEGRGWSLFPLKCMSVFLKGTDVCSSDISHAQESRHHISQIWSPGVPGTDFSLAAWTPVPSHGLFTEPTSCPRSWSPYLHDGFSWGLLSASREHSQHSCLLPS